MADTRESFSGNLFAKELGISENTATLDSFFGEDSDGIEAIQEEEVEIPQPEKKQTKAKTKQEATLLPDKEPLIPEVDPSEILGEDEDEAEEPQEEIPEPEAEEEPENNPYEAFANELYDLGFFEEVEGEEKPKTPEELLAKLNADKERGLTNFINNYLSQDGNDRADLFKAIFVDRVDPREYMPVYNEKLNIAELDMSSDINQQRVVAEYYRRQGWEQEQIQERLKKLADWGDLTNEAGLAQKQLMVQNQQELQRQEQERQIELKKSQQAEDEYRQSIETILKDKIKEKTFDGLPLNDTIKQKAVDFLYTKKWTLNGKPLTDFDKFILETKNPENHQIRVKLALLAMNNFDFSKIKASAITKGSSELFKGLATQKTKVRNSKSPASNNNDWASFL